MPLLTQISWLSSSKVEVVVVVACQAGGSSQLEFARCQNGKENIFTGPVSLLDGDQLTADWQPLQSAGRPN